MSRLSQQIDRFIRKVDLYRNCCSRIEQQYHDKRLRITDVELVYSSSFLSVCAQWEALLEATIFEAACGTPSRDRSNRRLVEFSKKKHLAQVLLFPDKDYIALPSVKRAEEVARLLVTGGMPIAAIDESSRTFLQQATWIRNAIAHEGVFAVQLFRKKVPGVEQLHPAKRFPGPFLRHEFRQSPAQRRHDLYFTAFKKAATDMERAW